MRALKANDVVCLLCDRDIAGGGVEVEFFGERTTLPGGPATLALRTGAPLLPDRRLLRRRPATSASSARPSPSSAQGKLRDDVARITQDLAHELEVLIRRAPDQWHLHAAQLALGPRGAAKHLVRGPRQGIARPRDTVVTASCRGRGEAFHRGDVALATGELGDVRGFGRLGLARREGSARWQCRFHMRWRHPRT